MKIIAKSRDGIENVFVLEATDAEIQRLTNHYYEPGFTSELKRGDVIDIHDMYDQLKTLKRKQKSAVAIATELRAMASMIELHDPIKKFEGIMGAVKEGV